MSEITSVASRRPAPFARHLHPGLRLPLALLVLWQAASTFGWIDPRFLPPPQDIVLAAWREVHTGELLLHVGASLLRDLTGFTLGTVAGILFGALLGLSNTADRLIGPSFHALKQIAVLAWIPIISVWFGFAETAKVAFVTLAAFLPVALNTTEGMRSLSPQILEVGRSLCLTPTQIFRRARLPAALPSILNGVHLALIYSWLATVGAEYFMAVGPGLGGLIIAGRERFEMDVVMLGVVMLGAIGYALNTLAERVEHRLLRWRDG
ncbi:ABC transporter permease [Rhizobiaceae bacterium BDR2-2]|uniref:ABC transporter permease n=1 Tax=Ectorhizobium quercum TaxID=2965071 RepID=A0AAE3MYU5_9HYPH|nr:ABC transporter permease [Ectorhizobium quercum]MCX8997474.1 ABC transporter permease [Ectorhizobium quercum]